MYQIIHERPQDADQIEPLLETCFGAERTKKTAYKIRENLQPLPQLSLVAVDQDTVLATIRYWPITIGENTSALLLGPIAVMPSHQGEGMGVGLIRESLKLATELGHDIVVLVGDQDYYTRFGFSSAFDQGLLFPGPVEPSRFLVSELKSGALQDVTGMVEGARLDISTPGEMASAKDTKTLLQELSALAPPSQT